MTLLNKNMLFGLLSALFLVGCQNSDTEAQSQNSDSDVANKVTIVEYSDYQCPACAYFHPMVDKLKQNFGDSVEVQLRYFPLNSHQYAALAARAAEAAKKQGKFYEMHSLLFENQQEWSQSGNATTSIINYAREIGLDMDQFSDDLNSGETQKVVMEQKQEGADRGVNSTPTFYIEGEEVDPMPRTYEEFAELVRTELEEKQNE